MAKKCINPNITQEKLQRILDATPNGLIIVDQTGKIILVNAIAEKMFGYAAGELIGESIEILVPPRSRHAHVGLRKSYSIHPESRPMGRGRDLCAQRKDGTSVPVEIGLSPLVIHGERLVISSIIDITERKNAERKLHEAHTQLNIEKRKLDRVLGADEKVCAIRHLNQLVDFVVDKATEILGVETCSLMLLDPKTQELLIRGARGVDDATVKKTRIPVGEQTAGRVAQDGRPLIVNRKGQSFLSVPIQLHDKLIGVVNVSGKKNKEDAAFSEMDLRILSTIVHQAAVAIENADYRRELEHLSITDSLTGLYNHRYFLKSLDTEIERANRFARPLTLLLISMDDFKSYNHRFGRHEGDRALQEIGKVIKKNFRATDTVCRYSGDEFVVVLPEIDMPQTRCIAEKIKNFSALLPLKAPVSVSMGAASYGRRTDRHDLIMKMHQSLRQAQKDGKGQICYFS